MLLWLLFLLGWKSEQRLLDGLDSYLERDHDRALFGLPPKGSFAGEGEILR